MYTILIIDGDPTNWYMEGTQAAAVEQQFSQPGPVSLPVVYPLAGDLIVSAKACGSIAILDEPPVVSWIPSGLTPPKSVLYVPSPAGPTALFPGYELPVGTNTGTLKQDLMAHMEAGTSFTTPANTVKGSGVVRLDGAVLSFAVIYTAPGNA